MKFWREMLFYVLLLDIDNYLSLFTKMFQSGNNYWKYKNVMLILESISIFTMCWWSLHHNRNLFRTHLVIWAIEKKRRIFVFTLLMKRGEWANQTSDRRLFCLYKCTRGNGYAGYYLCINRASVDLSCSL